MRVGEACARDSLSAAIHEACVQAGVSPQQIARTCAGIAGAGDDGVASLVQRLLIEILGGAIEVIGDMEVALESAFAGGPGVVVIAGTGSIVYGKNERGEHTRCGGWGRMVSDEGSGHWIGVEALRAALRAHDDGERSVLLLDLMAALGAATVHDLVVRANANPPPDFATLFPIVLAASEQGDSQAVNVLNRAGCELAKTAAIAVSKLFANNNASVATHGGVFTVSATVKQAFARHLRVLCPQALVVETAIDPALGALQRARHEFGVWHKQDNR